MKKITTIVIILAMLLSLVYAASANEVTKVTFASYQWNEAGYGDFYRYAAEKFHERYPQYEIEEVSIPVAQYWDKMIADCASDCPPDIMLYKAERSPAMIDAGELSDLSELFSVETMDRLSKEFQACQTSSPVYQDGKLYGLYMQVASHQLMYNERLLNEAGIAVPTTADEFVDAAIALTNGIDQYGYAFMTLAEDGFVYDIYMWALGFDANIFTNGFNFNTDGVKEALRDYKKLFDAGTTPIGTDKNAYRTMFAQGKVAFLIDGPWVYSSAKSLEGSDVANIKTAIVPFETSLSVMSENLLTIPADAAHKEGAALFFEMLTEKEFQSLFTDLTNCSTGMKNAVSDEWKAQNPWAEGYIQGAAGATCVVSDTYALVNNEIRKIILDECQEILYSDADINETVDRIQAQIEEVAEENGLK
ncbi:MAG: ABC transporter substrate-binding protein [Candidatus Excrementavichristensenella sp.]|jgi:multiple sugar transport system substrate-binding protein